MCRSMLLTVWHGKTRLVVGSLLLVAIVCVSRPGTDSRAQTRPPEQAALAEEAVLPPSTVAAPLLSRSNHTA